MGNTPQTRIHPPAWRVILAFLVAPGLGAFFMVFIFYLSDDVFNWEQFAKGIAMIAMYGAYPAAILFGIPTYFIVRRYCAPTLINCAFVGAAVATFPWAVIFLLLGSPDQASIGGQPTVIDGRRTVFGWYMDLTYIAKIAASGFAAGACFWLIAVAGNFGKEGKADQNDR